jgi:ribose/xylose/arabinose/galactoside ABC-type transport system permease subunit
MPGCCHVTALARLPDGRELQHNVQDLRDSKSFKLIGRGVIGSTGIPFIVVLFLAVAVVSDFLSRRSTVIRRIYYAGSNEKAARFSGINVNRVRMGVYVLA